MDLKKNNTCIYKNILQESYSFFNIRHEKVINNLNGTFSYYINTYIHKDNTYNITDRYSTIIYDLQFNSRCILVYNKTGEESLVSIS